MIDKSKMSVDEILLEKGILTIDQLKRVWGIQRETGKKIEDILVELQLVSHKDILDASASKMEMDFVDLSNFDFSDYGIPTLITESMANRYCMIPIERNGDSLIVAMKDPSDIFATDDVRLTTGYDVSPVFAEPKEIERLIARVFAKDNKQEISIHEDIINESEVINSQTNNIESPSISELDNISPVEDYEKDFSDTAFKDEDYSNTDINNYDEKIIEDSLTSENLHNKDSQVYDVKPGNFKTGENEKSFGGSTANVDTRSAFERQSINSVESSFNSNGRISAFDDEEESKPSLFKERLGKQLVRTGAITQDQLDKALQIQIKSGKRLGEILTKEGYIEKKVLYEILEKQIGIPHVDLENANISDDVVFSVSENIARRHKLVPIQKENNTLKVAMSDPMNIFSVDDLRLATGMEIVPLLADEEQIIAILNMHFEKPVKPTVKKKEEVEVQPTKPIVDLELELQKVNEEINVEISETAFEDESIDISDVDTAPIVRMVNIMFNKAVACHASDIHIEAYEDCVLIRFRVDGQLMEMFKYDKKVLPSLVARIKIISGLNIAEKRIPQDGRIAMKIDNSAYDMRVSVLPTMFGEKIVIRIADKDGFNVSKKDLGFFEDDLEKFENILSHPHGIVLVTGPTGSGKSTTLYTALRELCKPNVNILTVEDPVESTVRGINQVHVNVKAGLTFAAALRSFLRQDPDIIMVGEIRDGETAEIATRAAITGHLVLSTLHTNDAPSSVTRLIDMGIEPFLASSSLVGIIAQRLVRRLCPHCKEVYEPDENEKAALNIADGENITVYIKKGCEKCNKTGYRGRIAIYEIMTINSETRDLISKNRTADEIKQAALRNGMMTLRNNCARLVKLGVTTLDEMFRVTYSKE